MTPIKNSLRKKFASSASCFNSSKYSLRVLPFKKAILLVKRLINVGRL